MDKFMKKMVTSAVVLSTLCMVSVPVFAAGNPPDAKIAFDTEKVTGVNSTMEYSFDGEVWTPIFGTTLDISNVIGSQTSISVRVIGDIVTDNTKTLTIPARGTGPTVAFKTKAAGTDSDIIDVAKTVQYKIGNLKWTAGPESGGVLVGSVEKKGGKFLVRTAPTESAFATAEAELEVPMYRDAPDVAYDVTKDIITGVASTMEIAIGATYAKAVSETDGTGWVTVPTNSTEVPRKAPTAAAKFGLGDGTAGSTKSYIFIRSKGSDNNSGTSDTAASAVKQIEIPTKSAAAPGAKIDIVKEKITSVSATMEYRVLTNDQSKDGGNKTYSSPDWTSVSGTEINLEEAFSAAGTTGDGLKDMIEVRIKAIPASKTVPLAKTASLAKQFKIAARPATPKATDVTFDFDAETLAISKTANVVEFKVGTATAYTKETTGAAFDISKAGPIAIKIPDNGKGDLAVSIRVAAVPASDPTKTDTIESTPASVAYDITIPERPAAPEPSYDLGTTTVSGLTDKMQFKAYEVGKTAPDDYTTATATVNLSSVSTGALKGKKAVFEVRVTAIKLTAPRSASKTLASCEVVDKTALTSAINTAGTALTGLTVGTATGNVSSTAKDAFSAAIAKATEVKNDTAATQSKVDSAKDALDTATATLEAAKVPAPVTP